MTLTSGFFNSIGNDRLYDATDFSRFLEGIITNGCFPNDTGLKASANPDPILSDPPSVIINTGKGYLNGLWIYNDAPLVFYMGAGQQGTPGMYHLVYFEFDTNDGVRAASIKCITSANPSLPADGAGKYYMPLCKVADQQGSQPLEIHIEDLRQYAGVSGVGITTPSIVDGAITTAKIGNDQVTNAKMAPNSVGSTELIDDAVTLQKIAPGLYLPMVSLVSTFDPAGSWFAGATLAAVTPSVNVVALLTAGVYDDTAQYPARFHISIQYKVGAGAWTYITPQSVLDNSGSDLGGVFSYAMNITAGQTVQFRMIGKAAVAPQFSCGSFIYGLLLPR